MGFAESLFMNSGFLFSCGKMGFGFFLGIHLVEIADRVTFMYIGRLGLDN